MIPVCFVMNETFSGKNFYQKHPEIGFALIGKLLDMFGIKLRAGKPPQ